MSTPQKMFRPTAMCGLPVIDAKGTVHALVFPCRREGTSWIDSKLGRLVEVYPTYWQEWDEAEYRK